MPKLLIWLNNTYKTKEKNQNERGRVEAGVEKKIEKKMKISVF